MTSNNPSSTFFIFHAGKRLQINCTILNNNIIHPEVYEIDLPKLSSSPTMDENNSKKRKIDIHAHPPSDSKKLKIYNSINFIPIEIEFLLQQQDLFLEIISYFNIETIIKILRCVCKKWNDWIMIDFNQLWKINYTKICNLNINCQKSIFNLYILEKSIEKHSKFVKVNRSEYSIGRYEFYKDANYETIKNGLESRLFVLDLQIDSNDIGKDSMKSIKMISMLNLNNDGFVKFYFKYSQIFPKYGESTEKIKVYHKMLLNQYQVKDEDGDEDNDELILLETYHDGYENPSVERNDELIGRIMSMIGMNDRNLIRSFILFVTLDVVYNYCADFQEYNCRLSLVDSKICN